MRAAPNDEPPPDDAGAPQTLTVWTLPFDLYSRKAKCCSIWPRSWMLNFDGTCVQGNDGGDTHIDELRYAFDFSLPVGTPILAAADGIVVATVDCHRAGDRGTKEMRIKANYVALRHDCGMYTRYYHLCHKGVCVNVGERVHRGMQIGLSGNTGFSGGPHLHFDAVDVLATETATLALDIEGAPARPLECAAASFSAALPLQQAPLRARPVWADPPTASDPSLRNAAEAAGAIVLIMRCPDVDFIDKARRAEAAGAVAVIVVGDLGVAAPFTMGMPKKETVRRVGIPALMVTHAVGAVIREAVDDASRRALGGEGEAAAHAAHAAHAPGPTLVLQRSPFFRPRPSTKISTVDDNALAVAKAAAVAGNPTAAQPSLKEVSEFVPLTQPVRFQWPGHSESYLPRAGQRPPKVVQQAGSRIATDGAVFIRGAPHVPQRKADI